MDKYLITAPTTLPVGAHVGLSTEQADARAHALDKAGKHYVATAPLQFKVGEEISYDGELPKALAEGMSRAKASGKESDAGKEAEPAEHPAPAAGFKPAGPREFATPPRDKAAD